MIIYHASMNGKKMPPKQSLSSPQFQQNLSPINSAWVDASAGTGKTKTLIDRVVRLLLYGVEPQNILCLTFTNAAATEMKNRIFEKLSYWATIYDTQELDQELAVYLDTPPDEQKRHFAQNLFGKIVDGEQNGLQLQTLHAFCQTLLTRFPLEAGISPQFSILDDHEAHEKQSEALHNILNQDTHLDASKPQKALSELSEHVNEQQFQDIIQTLLSEVTKIQQIFEQYHNTKNIEEACCAFLDIPLSWTLDNLHQDFWQKISTFKLDTITSCLQAGSKTDIIRGEKLKQFCEADKTVENLWAFIDIFLTGTRYTTKRDIRKSLASKKCLETFPQLAKNLQDCAQFCDTWRDQYNRLLTRQTSMAIYDLAEGLLTEYQAVKQKHDYVDYNDLITLSLNLIQNIDSGSWVLFKLDQQIHHILVDESQDTSAQQWAFITALTQDFFAGESVQYIQDTPQTTKTIFAVGDQKQSIYSFQGASPHIYQYYKAFFSQHVTKSQQIWENITLDTNYRSSPQILSLVDKCFSETAAQQGVYDHNKNLKHNAFHETSGCVTLWPLITSPTGIDTPQWKPPVEKNISTTPRQRLAKAIAKDIHFTLSQQVFIPSKKRAAQPEDILILYRKRSPIIDEIIFELRQLNIPSMGVDRLLLDKQLLVQDLLALLKFILLPEDDLNFATLLKSPILNIDENMLFALCYERGTSSLWQKLQEFNDPRSKVIVDFLCNIQGKFQQLGLFTFFQSVISMPALFTSLTIEQNFYKRLGIDMQDILQEFLFTVYQYEQKYHGHAQLFLSWFENQNIEIKRQSDDDRKAQGVKFMTVHGAKGLQSPIVYLVDSHHVPQARETLLWVTDHNLFLWTPKKAFYSQKMHDISDIHKRQSLEEYHRLLYVALTRAQNHLHICGWQQTERTNEKSWHHHLKTIFDHEQNTTSSEFPYLDDQENWITIGTR